MKKILTLIAALLLTAATGMAQTVNVHKTDGTTVSYPASEVEYVDFTAASTDNPGGDSGQAPAGVVAVDLGLPSGTKWANMNVGATKPEDYGDYFRWAETMPFKEGDTYESYPYLGVDLGKSIAGTEYDAATANWGAPWKMPTEEQVQELMGHCTYSWTTQNGVNGALVTGPNGASIFFPASGSRDSSGDSFSGVGFYGYYWSASADGGLTNNARNLWFGSGYWLWSGTNRSNGLPVRAVAE